MDSREFISKAYDGNAFTTSETTAGYINPEIWSKQLLEHEKAKLVVAPLGKQYTDLLDKPGDTLNVTVGVTPADAADVAESDDVSITAFEKTQVVFSPSERGAAYQLTNKEKSRSFIHLAADMAMQLGYQLAAKKDTLAISTIVAGAGNAVVSNGVDSSDLASSDALDYEDIVNGRGAIMKDKLTPKYLVVGSEGYVDLLKDDDFHENEKFVDSVAKTGYIGRISGLDVFWTTQIGVAANVQTNFILGEDGSGTPAFGIAQKTNPYYEREKHALSRYEDIVAVEDYDIKVLRANAICTIKSYAA